MKTKTRVLSLIMTVAMILSSLVIVIPTSAEESTEITPDGNLWTGYEATAFEGGAGTEASPYQIATAAQLAYLAKLCNEQATDTTNNGGAKYSTLYYELTADIDARAHQWVAIGNVNDNNRAFQGHFNGNGFTVKTALTDITSVEATKTYFSTAKAHGALFGRIRNATIYDLNAEISYVWDQRPTATISTTTCMGLFAWGIYDASKLTNVHLTLDITGTVGTNKQPLGGFGGYVNAPGGVLDGCSVGGTLEVTDNNQIEFSPYFAIVSGGTNTGVTVKNCVNTMKYTFLKSGHQNFLGGIFCRNWSAADMIVTVKGYIDASKIVSPTTNYLHYGSISGHNQNTADKSTAVVHAEGVVSMLDLGSDFSIAGNTTAAGFANLFGSSVFKPHATNTFVVKNCYTTNPLLPDVHIMSNSINVLGPSGKTASLSGNNTTHELEGVTGASFEYKVSEDGTSTTVIIPKALYEAFAGAGDATVSLGDVSVAETTTVVDETTGESTTTNNYVTNEAGDYEFTLATTVGVGSISVTMGNGKTVTLTDKWTSRAEKIEAGSASAPTTITSGGQLAYLAWGTDYTLNFIPYQNTTNFVKTAYYLSLGNDIDLRFREWTAIGSFTAGNPYGLDWRTKVVLLGNGNAIQGLTITDATDSTAPAALFGGTANPTVIKDLNLTNVYINKNSSSSSSNRGVASVVAFAAGQTVLDNVHASGSINVNSTVAHGYYGGLVATAQNCSIVNSSMSGSVTVTSNTNVTVGGLVGKNGGYLDINNSVNNATVTAKMTAGTGYVGGILGATNSANAINMSYTVNNGDVTIAQNGETAPKYLRVGGIIGDVVTANAVINIDHCANFGTLSNCTPTTGGNARRGHLIGYDEADSTLTVTNTFAPKQYNANDDSGVCAMHVNTGKNLTVNGVKPGAIAHVPSDFESYFEIDTVDNGDGTVTVKMTKLPLDILAGNTTGIATLSNAPSGYSQNYSFTNTLSALALTLTYGEQSKEITSLSDLTADGDVYTYTFTKEDGAKATLTASGFGNELEADAATWAGMYVADTFANDDSETTDVIEIATAGELGRIARLFNNIYTSGQVNNKAFKLIADIDLAGAEWEPIGMTSATAYRFASSFVGEKADGSKPTISNLTLTQAEYVYSQSMFGATTTGFGFANIDLQSPKLGGAKISGTGHANAAATLVASMYGASTVDNVEVRDLSLSINNTRPNYAGLVGYMENNSAKVSNCTVSGKFTGRRDTANGLIFAGVVGSMKMGTVDQCVSNVKFDLDLGSQKTSAAHLGGIVGYIQSASSVEYTTVSNSTSNAEFKLDIVKSSAKGIFAIGGIVGRTNSTGKQAVSGCVSNVVINIDDSQAEVVSGYNRGAIVGRNDKKVNTNQSLTLTDNYVLNGMTAIGENLASSDTASTTVWDVAVTTKETAAVRINGSLAESGIRFKSLINTALYNAMKADENVTVEIGTLIATQDLLNNIGAEALDNLPADEIYDIYRPVKVVYNSAEFFGTEGDNSIFTGAIEELLEDNYSVLFNAVGYVKVTINGVAHTFYADLAGEGRSVKDLATAAFEDRSEVKDATSENGYTYNTEMIVDGDTYYSFYTYDELDLLAAYAGLTYEKP